MMLTLLPMQSLLADEAKATFAGGCFWCMEKPFEKLQGVRAVVSGYMGGSAADAKYKKVGKGQTGHREVIQVTYDPTVISFTELVDSFWKNIDPFDAKGQFCDKGFQYTTALYYHDKTQQTVAEQSKEKIVVQFSDKAVVTPVLAASDFYPAEDYHQDYYKKNPTHYSMYRFGCGRDRRLSDIWDN